MNKKFIISIPYFCYLNYEVEAETEKEAKDKIIFLIKDDSDIIPISFELGSRFGKVYWETKDIPNEKAETV